MFTGLLPAVSAEDAKTAVEEVGGALELLDGSRDGMAVITACPLNRKINQNLTRLAILLASRVFC